MKIIGILTKGLGEGALYMKKYQKYFSELFYPGTLNIKPKQIYTLRKAKITITPEEEGIFPVDLYPIIIQKTYKGYLIKPHKNKHKEIIEIISKNNLRETLQLNDGDEIECELE